MTLTQAIPVEPGRNEIQILDTARVVAAHVHLGRIVVVAIGEKYAGMSRKKPLRAASVGHVIHVEPVGVAVAHPPPALLGVVAYRDGLYCVFDGNRL